MTQKVKSKPTTRRMPKVLSAHLFAYTTPQSQMYAKTYGKRAFGSFSKYIDLLITLDRKNHFSREAAEARAKEKQKAAAA